MQNIGDKLIFSQKDFVTMHTTLHKMSWGLGTNLIMMSASFAVNRWQFLRFARIIAEYKGFFELLVLRS